MESETWSQGLNTGKKRQKAKERKIEYIKFVEFGAEPRSSGEIFFRSYIHRNQANRGRLFFYI